MIPDHVPKYCIVKVFADDGETLINLKHDNFLICAINIILISNILDKIKFYVVTFKLGMTVDLYIEYNMLMLVSMN